MSTATATPTYPRHLSTPLASHIAQAQATMPRRISRFAPQLLRSVDVQSHTVADQTHTVRFFDNGLVTCSCKGWAFRQTCRHCGQASRVTAMCATCHVNPVYDGFVRCASCAALPAPVVEAEPEWEPTAHCCRCGEQYQWSGETWQASLYCPACRN